MDMKRWTSSSRWRHCGAKGSPLPWPRSSRRAPVSAHLGDRAIVFADGRMEGFVGGACSREIIRRQALEALPTRRGRLVSIRPDAGDAAESTGEHVVVPMTCVSEGAVDVYVEPFVQARVAGRCRCHAGRRVAGAAGAQHELRRGARGRCARTSRYRAGGCRARGDGSHARRARGDPAESGARICAVVVASQGHYDEEALESILTCGVPYVGLVASRTRGAAVRALLEDRGVPGAATIRNPAGLDLGARTPPEVALSILAEIVQARPSGVRAAATAPPASPRASPRRRPPSIRCAG